MRTLIVARTQAQRQRLQMNLASLIDVVMDPNTHEDDMDQLLNHIIYLHHRIQDVVWIGDLKTDLGVYLIMRRLRSPYLQGLLIHI